MKTFKLITQATFHLFAFKPFTDFGRSTEIIFGISAWAFFAALVNSIITWL